MVTPFLFLGGIHQLQKTAAVSKELWGVERLNLLQFMSNNSLNHDSHRHFLCVEGFWEISLIASAVSQIYILAWGKILQWLKKKYFASFPSPLCMTTLYSRYLNGMCSIRDHYCSYPRKSEPTLLSVTSFCSVVQWQVSSIVLVLCTCLDRVRFQLSHIRCCGQFS